MQGRTFLDNESLTVNRSVMERSMLFYSNDEMENIGVSWQKSVA